MQLTFVITCHLLLIIRIFIELSIGSLDYGDQSCDRPRVPSLEPNTGMGTWLSSENYGSKLNMIVWGGFGPYRESLLTTTLRLKTIISGILLYVIFQLKITLFRTLFLIILKRARRPGICRKKTHQNYDLKILGCVLKHCSIACFGKWFLSINIRYSARHYSQLQYQSHQT